MNGMFLLIGLIAPPAGEKLYLDPGSGSFILQILLATLLGGFVLIRSYWNKIKDFLTGLFNKNKDQEKGELDE